MRVFLILLRREFGNYFTSLNGYVIISAVLFLIGFSFTEVLDRLNGLEPTDMPVTEIFYQTWYFWYILLLSAPLITMRSFAVEKSLGTFETLVTTPVSDAQVVFSKFASAMLFHMVMWLPLLACVGVVRHYSSDQSAFGPGVIASTYLGIFLLGSLYMSMGCFASSLTRSQIIAAMVSFLLGMAIFLLSIRTLYGIPQAGWVAKVFANISMMEHMQDFVRGVVDTRYVVFYLSGTAFFLYLTLKVVESRRWK